MCFALGYPVWNTLGFLNLGDYFLPHFRDVFNCYLLKYFLMAFLSVFFFWDSYGSNFGAFDIVPEVSEFVLISFDSFFYFPLCLIYFHHSIFYLTYPIFCLCWQRVRWLDGITGWTWVWVNSGSLQWTGRPGVLQSMGHKELDTADNGTDLNWCWISLNFWSSL